VIGPDALAAVRDLGLSVVTQPIFVRERGDRYLAEVDAADRDDLYRCASLRAAGIPVAASSDAPYGSPDPWLGIAAAIDRRTREGAVLGAAECVSAPEALALWLDDPAAPGRKAREIAVGAVADLCLLDSPLKGVLAAPASDRVAATLIGGEVVFRRGG